MIIKVNVAGQVMNWHDKPPKVADKSIEFVQFQFLLSEDWDGYTVTAQFSQKGSTYNQLLVDGCCMLPADIGEGKCFVSVFGYKHGEPGRGTVLPLMFTVDPSGFVSNGNVPVPPDPDLYAQLLAKIDAAVANAAPQIQAMIGDLDKLNTTAKENLVAAVNEAMKTGGVTDEATVQRIVNEYLSANPPTVTETDPTVPAWAKQPTKPTYTAAEVGALPDTYTLPAATETTLGGVKPVTATEAMTQPVGVDANGALYTEPGKGGGSEYVLPIGGAELGGVKNGGNVTINADGTMTAPENEISGEQVSSAVSEWLDAHPEATTTVGDGSINPDKTTWMRQVYHNIFDVSTITDGCFFYDASSDKIAGGGTADYFASDYIPVVAGREYVFSNKNMVLRWTDANKTFISGSASNVSVVGQKVTAPDGAAFVRFSLPKGGLPPEEIKAQVYEYMGEEWEYDTYKNLYSILITDAGYSKAVADLLEGKFLDGSLAPADLFADESIRYKQIKGIDEFHWNIIDKDKLEEGTIDSTTGADKIPVNSFVHRRTAYIPVTIGETLYWMWHYVYGYDADKNFVCEVKQTSGIGVVPDGVHFIRATGIGNNTEPAINIYRRGYGKYDLTYASVYDYTHGFPVFKDEDSKEGFKAYLGIHPWEGKNFGIIGDSFTAPGTWCNIMAGNLKVANYWNKAISGANFGDADGVPKTAYEQAQEFVADGKTLDVILITMGTNDANNSRTIGEIVESNSIDDFDLTTYTGGMQACLNYLQNNFPNAIIYVGWTPMSGLVNGTKAEYVTRMQEVCLMYGVEYIETRTCGVTRFSDAYAECYEGGANGGHPTGAGQQKIGAYMTRLMKSKL